MLDRTDDTANNKEWGRKVRAMYGEGATLPVQKTCHKQPLKGL